MIEAELNSNDKLRLKKDIKMSLVFTFLFCTTLIIILGAILGIMLILGKQPIDGFIKRGLYITALLFIPFFVICCINLLKYIDLKKGKKLVFTTNNYEVINKKDNCSIVIKSYNSHKIKINDELVPLIKLSQPLTLGISNLTKSLLFISHNNDNLLDNLYSDDK